MIKCRISGEVDWTQKSYTLSAGIHSLKWRYVKDSSGNDGDDCGWLDFVQWTGASPVPDSDNWQQLDFKYDVYGRRSEKLVDGYATRYLGACGERSRIQRPLPYGWSLGCTRDACARAPRTTRDGVLAEYDGHPQDGLAATTC